MGKFFKHYFYPHESNNYRAKLLHHKTLLFLIIILFVGGFFLSFVKTNFSSVLGISSNVTLQELLVLTNKEREANGLPSLKLSSELSSAAEGKASSMLSENYWSHESPSGATPWVFIKNAGYNYTYAGENLARGFTNTQEVINAWMASPTHRQNMLSSNYKEVGFAIRTGVLTGEETVLVVEMFGSRELSGVPQTASTKPEIAAASNNLSASEEEAAKEEVLEETQESKEEKDKNLVAGINLDQLSKSNISAAKKQPLINNVSFSSNTVRIIVGLVIFVLALDMMVVKRKKLVRFVGHNIDHIFFLSLVLILIGFLAKGVIV